MKPPTKPISSPGRTEKFPPPLMRFLRNNASSRSRGRSRTTTAMFLRKKNTNNIETQEPSSPKVTCMGQVRVKRSASKRVPSAGAGTPTKFRCCSWVPHALFFHRLIKPEVCFPFQCKQVWPNWRFLQRKKRDSKVTETSSPKTELNFRGRFNPNYDDSEHKDRVIVNPPAFVSNTSSTPPRNALLLTRCRSAPGRRFLNEETEVVEKNRVNREHSENNRDRKLEAKLRFFKELEESLRERIIMESEKAREESDSVHPLVLTRCKSEPARTAQKLDPEMNGLSKKTTLGFAHAWFSHGL
ncbi:hypothetical protein AAZX31_10G048300 [Glycine max]|uniref:Uncharacterized protein n=2 Tax=Glycine subgen. Soja TaxID=1462606 RepID=I1L8T3_SOYBN|nr:uncharacterized protein LOC102660188 [Glycine max]XP_028183382.1 uncharacterized protein LOC114370278 [Glycine soja]KAG4982102.1 hypothetical protein JHK87_026851 [Glycine soja]KAG4996155.1 hypothetical protein JHK85_027594 [Glycine max]KAG5002957.1 hypothetical protein JHK86_027096 [Glycine max]KAG5150730.1 hypothetical protein JHK84_027202 [Glycine max]KAH1136832.1 hypothetical protein GYH30_027015 [Glycine max]|eukprot:XP_006589824.1 uncharacterized protein LOC102660188 [Glycine max]